MGREEDIEEVFEHCDKCKGAGWLWHYELDEYSGPAADLHDCYGDDTQYLCDRCGGFERSMKNRGLLVVWDGKKLSKNEWIDFCQHRAFLEVNKVADREWFGRIMEIITANIKKSGKLVVEDERRHHVHVEVDLQAVHGS